MDQTVDSEGVCYRFPTTLNVGHGSVPTGSTAAIHYHLEGPEFIVHQDFGCTEFEPDTVL